MSLFSGTGLPVLILTLDSKMHVRSKLARGASLFDSDDAFDVNSNVDDDDWTLSLPVISA